MFISYLCLDASVFQLCKWSEVQEHIRCDSGEEIHILWGYCTFLEDCDNDEYLARCHVNQTSDYIDHCNGETKCKVACDRHERPIDCTWSSNMYKQIDVGYLCKFVTVYIAFKTFGRNSRKKVKHKPWSTP